MKKLLSLLLVIVMFASMTVGVGARSYSFRCGVNFKGVDDLELGTSVRNSLVACRVYRFVLDKPTKLEISIVFNRSAAPSSGYGSANYGNNMSYFISDDSLGAFLPGGARAFERTSESTYNGCITSGYFDSGSSDLSRTHYIGSQKYTNGKYNSNGYHYTGPADLLPAGTYYLSLNYPGGDERDTYTVTIDCIHEDTYEKTVSEPTCDKEGEIEIICSGCGRVADTKEIDKLPHTPADEWIVTDATCAADGKKEIFCIACNEVAKIEKIEALPHTYGEWSIDKETSCKAAGEKSRVCLACGDEEKEEIAALSHTYGEWVIDKEVTCTATGEMSHICSVCEYKEKEELDKLAHTFGEWEITTQATCSSSGKQKHTCTVCGKSETQSIDAIEHEFGKWEATTEATCTSTGKETRKCKNCSKSETRTTDKTDHNYDDWKVITKATCTSLGKEQGYCNLCDKTVTEVIPMPDHDYGEWKVITEATCAAKGKKSATCTVCGRTETETIPMLDHTFGEPTVTTEATCTKTGKQSHTCTVCGRTETETIDKTEHTVEEWTITKEATETRKGTRKGTCTVCGKSFSESYTKPKYPGRDGFKASRDYTDMFTDVGNEKWFYSYVETAYEYGLANGMSATKFSPDNKFTVAQALTVAANIHAAYYGKTVEAAKDGEQWYTPYVNYCIENEIITETQFADYTKNITRGEMAIVFANILPDAEYGSVRDGNASDMDANMESYGAVQKLYNAGIVSGDANTGNYRPADEIVRSEACVIFTRIAVTTYRAN